MRRGDSERIVVTGSGLSLAARVYAPEADGPLSGLTLVLVHGYLDAGDTFGPFVRALPPELRVVTFDVRGHGRSEAVPPSCWYHFWDYARDLRAVVDVVAPARLAILGHSMGGGIASLFAGAWPENVERLVLIEGLGPPDEAAIEGPQRLARWVRELRDGPRGGAARFAERAAVVDHLTRQNPAMAPEHAAELADALAEPRDGGWAWRHDPRHRARTPMLYDVARYAPFWDAVACPVLLVTGERSWYRWPDLEARRAHFRDRRRVHLDNVGHMVHYEAPQRLAGDVAEFLRGREPEGAMKPSA